MVDGSFFGSFFRGGKNEQVVAEVRVFLEIVKAIFSNDFKNRFKRALLVLEELREKDKGIEYFETIVRYIMNAKDDITEKELEEVAEEISSERSGEIMTIAERLKKEGMEKGKKEMVNNLLKLGVEVDKIIEASGLSKEEIDKIKDTVKH